MPTMTRLEAVGRFHMLHGLLYANIPFVVWGLEALACNSVPTYFRDPLEVLVPEEYLREAARVIENDRSSFYRRIEPFDHVDDYTFPREVSVLVRRNLKNCEYLHTPRTTLRFQPWQIVLIPDHIFKFKTSTPRAQGFAQIKRLPPYRRLRGVMGDIKVPTFLGMLNAIYGTIDFRCRDKDDDIMRRQLEEQADALIMWRIQRDECAEVYSSSTDLPEDLKEIRNGLYPQNRKIFDSKYLLVG
ncbi:hypothetical protein TWF481_004919 [Arthrobotrys musiformis]|uniref:Uncharacterized protein n=1 Tax=Arthrobotrys musiformis TaxID=47236 RepID=A0AAV9WL65_9PEZI